MSCQVQYNRKQLTNQTTSTHTRPTDITLIRFGVDSYPFHGISRIYLFFGIRAATGDKHIFSLSASRRICQKNPALGSPPSSSPMIGWYSRESNENISPVSHYSGADVSGWSTSGEYEATIRVYGKSKGHLFHWIARVYGGAVNPRNKHTHAAIDLTPSDFHVTAITHLYGSSGGHTCDDQASMYTVHRSYRSSKSHWGASKMKTNTLFISVGGGGGASEADRNDYCGWD